jgi:hypothetical protein
MNLKRNQEIKVSAWVDDNLVCNPDWEVYSQEEEDTLYIFVKDPNTEKQIKFKIEKSIIIEESPIN